MTTPAEARATIEAMPAELTQRLRYYARYATGAALDAHEGNEEVMGAGKACADVLALLAGRPEAKDGVPRPDLRDLGRDLRAAVAPRIDALRRAVSTKDGAAPSPELPGFVKVGRSPDGQEPIYAPAAPSPDLDLAALEELSRNIDQLSSWPVPARQADALRTAILHLKAQPNAGPSADGGKGGSHE